MTLLSRALLVAACLLIIIQLSEVNSQEDLSLVSNTFKRKCNTLFRIRDRNKDGFFTVEDRHQLTRDFAKLAQLNKTYENYLHDVQVPQLCQELTGTNTSGEHINITREAMVWSMIIYRNNREPKISHDANRMFKIGDLDQNGFLSRSEHGIAFKTVGLGPGEIALSFRSFDINGDGVICRHEYVSRFISFNTLDCIDCPSKYIYGPLD